MMLRATAFSILAALAAHAQPVPIVPTDLGSGVHMLKGLGGNIGVLVTDQGVLMIDSQFQDMTRRIRAAIAKITGHSVRYVVNTHWHFDHTGGNRAWGEHDAVIIAHANVRQRMTKKQFIAGLQREVPPSPKAALPTLTFTDGMTFHWGDEEVRIVHVKNAHTDGDCFVYLKKANVLHMGDTFFNGLYPFVDSSSGGSVQGLIAAVKHAHAMCDDKTQIIPGHGPIANKATLAEYLAFLQATHTKLKGMLDRGMTVDEIIAAKPTAATDEELGQKFLKPDQFLRTFLGAMRREAK